VRLPGLRRLCWAADWVGRRYGRNWSILAYHRIAEPETDPWNLCVSPKNFEQQIQVLRATCRCMSLGELAQGALANDLPERAVALTFDDGYADNLTCAADVLERYEVPATVFLATGYIDGEREFWWDELERIFLQPGILPSTLELTIGPTQHRWHLGSAAEHSAEAFTRYRGWKVRQKAPTRRHHIYKEVYRLLRSLVVADRETVLAQLRAWAAVPQEARATHRILRAGEAADLVRRPCLEVGAHGVDHLELPGLAADEKYRQIAQSKAECERLVGHEISAFSYPFNLLDETSKSFVQASGMRLACAGYGELKRARDRLALPRLPILNWGRDRFAREMALGWNP
jgi:peptidoglycan/xylan/chitin deacetylase (PgdA/CDA1 family)